MRLVSADFSCAGMGKSSRRKGYRGFHQEDVHHAMRGMELGPGFVRRKREESTVDPGLAMESVVMEYAVMESA